VVDPETLVDLDTILRSGTAAHFELLSLSLSGLAVIFHVDLG